MIFISSGSSAVTPQRFKVTKTDVFTTTSTSWVDVPGLSITITPTTASSKFKITAFLKGGATSYGYARVLRDSTPIGVGDIAGVRQQASFGNFYDFHTGIRGFSFIWIDEPNTTSAITYKLQVIVDFGYTLYLGRASYDENQTNRVRTAQYLEVEELL